MGQSQAELIALAVVFMVLPLLFVALRVYSQTRHRQTLSLDGCTLLSALLLNCGMCLCVLLGATIGNLGQHDIASADSTVLTSASSRKQKQTDYALNILFPLASALTKITFLFLYRRLFFHTISNYVLEAITFTFITTIIIWGLAYSIASVFLCQPIATSWTYTTLPVDGTTCFPNAFYDTLGATDLATAFMVLALPVPAALNKLLTFSRGKRIAVCGVFLVGVFVVVASAVRLCYFLIQGSTAYRGPDASYDSGPLEFWAIIEIGVGISCACLPSFGPFVGLPPSEPEEKDAESRSGSTAAVRPQVQDTHSGDTGGTAMRESAVSGSDKTAQSSHGSWRSAVWPLPPSTQPDTPIRTSILPPRRQFTLSPFPIRAPAPSRQQQEVQTTPVQQTPSQSTVMSGSAKKPAYPQRTTSRGVPVIPNVSGKKWPQRTTSQRSPADAFGVAGSSQAAEAAVRTPQWPERTTSQRAAPPPGSRYPQRSPLQRMAEWASPAQPPSASTPFFTPPIQPQRTSPLHPQTIRPSPNHQRNSSHPSVRDQPMSPASAVSSRVIPIHRRAGTVPGGLARMPTVLVGGREYRVQRDSNGGLATFYAFGDDDSEDAGTSR